MLFLVEKEICEILFNKEDRLLHGLMKLPCDSLICVFKDTWLTELQKNIIIKIVLFGETGVSPVRARRRKVH